MAHISKIIAEAIQDAGLNYAFMEWKGKPAYPYFIGEYQEEEPVTEDGLQEISFILTGFTRRSWADLEVAKKTIKRIFHPITGHTVTADKTAVAIFYGNAFPVPTGDGELKKMQIELTVKEWSVI